MAIEKLHGRTSGTTRADLLEFATLAATGYYQAPAAQFRIELSNVTTEWAEVGTYQAPTRRTIVGYEGDFTAEAILP